MKDLLVVDSLNVSNKFQQHILNDISFTVHYSSITAILGKSGAGKTILARSLLDLLPESFSYSGGSVFFNQKSYLSPEENNLSGLRGRKIAIVFQEAVSYLNPVFKTGNQFLDILKTYHQLSRAELVDIINTAFNEVHLKDYQKVFNLYPHQLSSGMAQRAMLALALALAPEMLILDPLWT